MGRLWRDCLTVKNEWVDSQELVPFLKLNGSIITQFEFFIPANAMQTVRKMGKIKLSGILDLKDIAKFFSILFQFFEIKISTISFFDPNLILGPQQPEPEDT